MTFEWKNVKNFGEASSHLFNNEFLSDIKFTFPNNQIIHAHSFLLSLRGRQFHTAFEKSIGIPKLMQVENVSFDIFFTFLKYVYSVEDYEPNSKYLLEIMKLATHYQVYDLIDLCSRTILNNMSVDNVCKILEYTRAEGLQEIEQNANNFITLNARKIIANDSFTLIHRDTLKYIMDLPFLRDETDEFEIFQSVIKWTKKACDDVGLAPTGPALRSVLGEILKSIRFPIMTADQFGQCSILAPKLLVDTEISAIFLSIISEQKNSIGFLEHKRFNKIIINKTDQQPAIKIQRQSFFCMEFTLNKPILLTGVSFYVPKGQHTLKIISNDNSIIYEKTVNKKSESSMYWPIVEAFKISPRKNYEIRLVLQNVEEPKIKGYRTNYILPMSKINEDEVEMSFTRLSPNIEYLSYSL